jgi:hypothetical protein
VGALGEPVNFQIRLWKPDGTPFVTPYGDPISGSLNPYETVRFLGVLTGNNTDVRAAFSVNSNAAYIGFCTVESDVGGTGSADFRLAKSIDARDARQQRLSCYGQDDCSSTVLSVVNPTQISNTALRNIHYVILDQPDFVGCTLVGARAGDLEMRLRQPGDIVSSAQFPATPPYSSGGHTATSFYVDTGPRGSIGGSTTRWYIDVQFRSGGNSTTPIPYGITCTSGNGTSVPWLGATTPAAAF